MITARDAEFHVPAEGDFAWTETNYFSFLIPKCNLVVSIYVVVRQDLGVAMSDITIFDRLSSDRRQCLYIDSRQHLPSPAKLSDYTLANGLSVRTTRAPYDYEIAYRGEGVEFDFTFQALMAPQDINDPELDPLAANKAEDEAFEWACYKGHFDLTGRITGQLRMFGEVLPIDCVDTMDHSWGPRPEDGLGITGGGWLHCHFSPDYAIHCMLMFDPSKPRADQYSFIRGYVLDGRKVVALTNATFERTDDTAFGAPVSLSVTDTNGRQYRCIGIALSGAPIGWYTWAESVAILYEWTSDDGSVGYGCAMDMVMMPAFCGRSGFALGALNASDHIEPVVAL